MIIKLGSARLLHEVNLLLINYDITHEFTARKDQHNLIFYTKDISRLLIEYNRIWFDHFRAFFNAIKYKGLRAQLKDIIVRFVDILNKYMPSKYTIEDDGGEIRCNKCDSTDVTINVDGYNLCSKCGYMNENNERYYIIENFNSDSINVNKRSQYRESHHFTEIFDYYHGEVKRPLSNEVIAMIESEVILRHSAQPFDNYETLTPRDLKTIMKHIRFPNGEKYYNYIPYVYTILTGRQIMNVKSYRDTIMMQFNELLSVWDKYIKNASTRNSFLSSHYVFYQLLIKNGLIEESKQVMLLKSAEKKKEHDELYGKMCAILKWDFAPVEAKNDS